MIFFILDSFSAIWMKNQIQICGFTVKHIHKHNAYYGKDGHFLDKKTDYIL